MIQFDHVSVQYGNYTVLKNLTLEISGGEFVMLVGPSGAGKSTLLNALVGEIPVSQGSIRVDGYEVTQFSPAILQDYRRKLGMVFQDYKLLENKTVFENVAFALEVCGWKEADIQERVYEVLDLVGMLDHADKFPAHLAGGEVQRIAIARALVHRPRLLIADEPTGNLDFKRAQEILDLLLEINRGGATVIMATHNRELVDQVRKRVVTLNSGEIISDKENSGYDVELFLDEISIESVGEIEIVAIEE